jgi:nucleoside-diphosphate-sugar epimerase
MTQNIFITGASGCVGHYVFRRLIADSQYHLHLLVRNPKKLQFDPDAYPNLTVYQGDLGQIENYKEVLKTMDQVIHLAAAWGGGNTPFEINLDASLKLFQLLEDSRCHRILYFSTASILNDRHQPMPEAGKLGSDYIRSKYICHEKLPNLKVYDKIITLYPTVIFGGDKENPYTPVSLGIPEVARWVKIARFLRVDGSLHFIHAHDIAMVVQHIVEHGSSEKNIVLGNPNITAEEVIREFADYLGYKIPFTINLSPPLVQLIIKVFNIQIDPFERFQMETRHLRYNATNPETLGIHSKYSTLKGILSDYI